MSWSQPFPAVAWTYPEAGDIRLMLGSPTLILTLEHGQSLLFDVMRDDGEVTVCWATYLKPLTPDGLE